MEIKMKKDNSFLSPQATLMNFIKNPLQAPACKSRGEYKDQAKADKFKNQGKS